MIVDGKEIEFVPPAGSAQALGGIIRAEAGHLNGFSHGDDGMFQFEVSSGELQQATTEDAPR